MAMANGIVNDFMRKQVIEMKQRYTAPTFHLVAYGAEENMTLSFPNVDNNPNLDSSGNWTETNKPF